MATAAVVGFGAAALKLGHDFDQAFTRIGAISNASAKDIDVWRQSVLALSRETAQAPTELADALFFLSSAGLEASQVMPALEMSAKASAVGLGETADIASILASALNAYADSGLTAAQATDTLVAAVREGRAEPEEFAGALGRILPIASTIGVTFDQVSASLASLSNIGLDVNEGVTAMRGVFQALAAPGKQAAEAMASVGISAQEMLDVISEEGIVGALRLLDRSVKANTTGTAAYNNVMRQIVPNVRALTGVFGLTVQEAEKVNDIFNAVRDSTGALGEAFEETAASASFQLEQALNDLRVTATDLGSSALPAVTTFATGLTQLISTIPGLGVGLGDAGQQAAMIAQALDAGTISAAQADAAMQSLANRMGLFTSIGGELEEEIKRRLELEEREADIRSSANSAWHSYSQVLESSASAARENGTASREMAERIERGVAAQRRAAEALRQWKDALVESTRVAIGQFEKVGDAFGITPDEMRRHLRTAITVARQFTSDLRAILQDDSLTRAQKQALASLPPEYRNAFVKAKGEARDEIIRGATELQRLNRQKFGDIARAGKGPAAQGGGEVGRAIMSGVSTGIRDGAAAAAAAGVAAVNEVIARMNRAAQVASPSKLTAKTGEELMNGIIVGIRRGLPRVTTALQDLRPLIRDAIGVGAADQVGGFIGELNELERRFTSLQDRIRGFRDAITQGFSGFADLVGGMTDLLAEFEQASAQALEEGLEPPAQPDLQAFLTDQIAQAQEFADVLSQLQQAGLSTANLQQLAAQGPEALGLGQALLANPALIEAMNEAQKAIAEVTKQTADTLVAAEFGKKVEKLGEEFRELTRHVREFIRGLKVPELSDETREFINALTRLRHVINSLSMGAGAPSAQGGGTVMQTGLAVVHAGEQIGMPAGLDHEALAKAIAREIDKLAPKVLPVAGLERAIVAGLSRQSQNRSAL